jgi:hypothetical protein
MFLTWMQFKSNRLIVFFISELVNNFTLKDNI